ncbi:pyruvate, water dikinase regulatory protein [Litoribrevibacter euphylliae]|uniref:Putative phosphoenolpyruvate synthase regulatory protein n=1 Tax=Litoribrevibacter euphylliae TaxID=1834034 RepID=A0ABV7HET0_9GAMM
MKRTVFFISDGTGITAEALGNALLTQFEGIEFDRVLLPYIDTIDKARATLERIHKANNNDGVRPIIFDTIVNKEIREFIRTGDGFPIDIFETFLSPLEQELGHSSSYSVGKSHSIDEENRYKGRIDAVHFAMDNDDGALTKNYDKADIILVGVSRCGKTPTCIYMALQYGLCAANYPLTEEDMKEGIIHLPKFLENNKHKLFGLTIDAENLSNIRNERRANSRYASLAQCEMEVDLVEELFIRFDIPYINSTYFSIEEISAKILDITGIERKN